jgi:hypothetical protein
MLADLGLSADALLAAVTKLRKGLGFRVSGVGFRV